MNPKCHTKLFVATLVSDHCKFTIQWSLSNVDTVRTKIIVLISEVSFFQREKNMYLHKDGLKQVS